MVTVFVGQVVTEGTVGCLRVQIVFIPASIAGHHDLAHTSPVSVNFLTRISGAAPSSPPQCTVGKDPIIDKSSENAH